MSNFKSQAKRKRELAKLDKRKAKEQKRAARKVEQRAGVTGIEVAAATVAPATVVAAARPSALDRYAQLHAPVPERKPLTLAEAVERWKASKPPKPKYR